MSDRKIAIVWFLAAGLAIGAGAVFHVAAGMAVAGAWCAVVGLKAGRKRNARES